MSSSKLYFEKLSLFLFLKVLSPRRSVVADIYLYGDRFDLGNYSRILYFILCRVKNSTSRNCPPLFLFYPRGRGDYLYGDRFDLGNSKTLPREIGVFLPSFFFCPREKGIVIIYMEIDSILEIILESFYFTFC